MYIYIYIYNNNVDYTGLTQQIKFCANKSGFESHVLKLSPHALRFKYIYIYTHHKSIYIYINLFFHCLPYKMGLKIWYL